jgi:hypothetical protein
MHRLKTDWQHNNLVPVQNDANAGHPGLDLPLHASKGRDEQGGSPIEIHTKMQPECQFFEADGQLYT